MISSRNINSKALKVLVIFIMLFCTIILNAQGPPDGGTDTSDTFPHQLRLSLYESTALANDEDAADTVIIVFDSEGNNALDDEDTLNNDIPDENVAIINSGVYLSIEKRNIPTDQEQIQLDISTYLSTNYVLVAEGIDMPGAPPFLYDAYADSYTEISQDGILEYQFSIDTNIPATEASDRFSIVFSNSALSITNNSLQEIKLYPNPSNNGIFYLNIPSEIHDLEVIIFNILGTKLYHKSGFATRSIIAVETGAEFSEGTYFIKLSAQGRSMIKKLIIN